jgi:hypothetical protein
MHCDKYTRVYDINPTRSVPNVRRRRSDIGGFDDSIDSVKHMKVVKREVDYSLVMAFESSGMPVRRHDEFQRSAKLY